VGRPFVGVVDHRLEFDLLLAADFPGILKLRQQALSI
jgi:hypothetical protein